MGDRVRAFRASRRRVPAFEGETRQDERQDETDGDGTSGEQRGVGGYGRRGNGNNRETSREVRECAFTKYSQQESNLYLVFVPAATKSRSNSLMAPLTRRFRRQTNDLVPNILVWEGGGWVIGSRFFLEPGTRHFRVGRCLKASLTLAGFPLRPSWAPPPAAGRPP